MKEINKPGPDNPIRFPVDDLQVWARTQMHAREIARGLGYSLRYKSTHPAPERVCNCGPGAGWDKEQRCLRCGLPLDDPEVATLRREREEMGDVFESARSALRIAREAREKDIREEADDALAVIESMLRKIGRIQ